jgi:hypothetical protein
VKKLDQAARVFRARLVLDTGVDVFRILTEDHHVHRLWRLDRRGDASEIADRPHAGIQIQLLPQSYVE